MSMALAGTPGPQAGSIAGRHPRFYIGRIRATRPTISPTDRLTPAAIAAEFVAPDRAHLDARVLRAQNTHRCVLKARRKWRHGRQESLGPERPRIRDPETALGAWPVDGPRGTG